MKKIMSVLVIMTVLFCGVPCLSAEEIAQDLDPMVSPDAAATVTNESSVNPAADHPMSDVVKSADAIGTEKRDANADKKKFSKKKKKSEKSKAETKKQKSGKKMNGEKKKQNTGKSAKHKFSDKKNLPGQSAASKKVQ